MDIVVGPHIKRLQMIRHQDLMLFVNLSLKIKAKFQGNYYWLIWQVPKEQLTASQIIESEDSKELKLTKVSLLLRNVLGHWTLEATIFHSEPQN